jgi:hypothetical protein
MIQKALMVFVGACVAIGLSIHAVAQETKTESPRVFELRTYTAAPGKLEDLHRRFREHTLELFERHGMVNIGYWSPQDSPASTSTIVYLLAHKSKAAAKKSWDDFGADPEWRRVKSASEANGSLVTKVESVFFDPTDYSPMR